METCKANYDIDWLFFSDNSNKPAEAENIKQVEFSLSEFNDLASDKLDISVGLKNPYKVCDFKPAFGKIFEEYINGYEFWCYFDVDLLFGNISHFINNKTLDNFDLISTYLHFLSGPFCLFRNEKYINQLYSRVSEYDEILQDPEHFGFDEIIQRKEIEGVSLRKLGLGFHFLMNKLMKKGVKFFKVSKDAFLYEFQWFCKRKTIQPNYLEDMTEVVWNYSALGKVKVLFTGLMESDRSYEREKRKDWMIIWEKGILYDVVNKKELFGFHFVDHKNDLFIDSTEGLSHISKITITEKTIKVD